MHFLLFSPVLLVSTLLFMTAYVTLGLDAALQKTLWFDRYDTRKGAFECLRRFHLISHRRRYHHTRDLDKRSMVLATERLLSVITQGASLI